MNRRDERNGLLNWILPVPAVVVGAVVAVIVGIGLMVAWASRTVLGWAKGVN